MQCEVMKSVSMLFDMAVQSARLFGPMFPCIEGSIVQKGVSFVPSALLRQALESPYETAFQTRERFSLRSTSTTPISAAIIQNNM